jgi:hypothetical protein
MWKIGGTAVQLNVFIKDENKRLFHAYFLTLTLP